MNKEIFALDRIQAAVMQRQTEVGRLLGTTDSTKPCAQSGDRGRLEQERDFLALLLAMIPAA